MKKKLLVADDDPGIRALVVMTLESPEYEIIEAANGQEALALTKHLQPDVALLDVMMPKMSGMEVCEQIKSDPALANVRVVMLTANSEDSDRMRAMAAGADDYFTKPFSPVALLRKIDELFGS